MLRKLKTRTLLRKLKDIKFRTLDLFWLILLIAGGLGWWIDASSNYQVYQPTPNYPKEYEMDNASTMSMSAEQIKKVLDQTIPIESAP